MPHLTAVSLNSSQSWGKRCLWKEGEKKTPVNSKKTLRENCSLKIYTELHSRATEGISSMWHI